MSGLAIYCRISTQMQKTDRQKEELLARAKAQNIEVQEEHIYIDVISGFIKGEVRPKYIEMMKAVEMGEIKEIWFSELTRLGRSSVELLTEIQKLQKKGITLYFQKQNITVTPNKSDIGQQILLSVLAVCASYEIELFSERSVSGKITKVKNGGGIGGDNDCYGYKNDVDKKMVIREDEAKIVRLIFELYAQGRSTLNIADILNADKIPTPLSTRAAESARRREIKGLEPKENPNLTRSTKKWKPNMVSKVLSKKLYTGHRHIIFHKPNMDKESLNKEREIYFEYDELVDDLRIIPDELFQQVQERLLQAPYNKNNSLKHENLLKHKIKCGECNSNFSVGKSNENSTGYLNGGRTYVCYGTINRKDKPKICNEGASIRQWRLDGLVLQLSIRLFADIDLKTNSANQISELLRRNDELQHIITQKSKDIKEATSEYERKLNRLSIIADDLVAEKLIRKTQSEYQKTKEVISTDIEKYNKEKISNSIIIKNLENISKNYNLYKRMDEIWKSRELVKTMIDELIEEIILYRPHPIWILVIVKYKNNIELWGTLKSKKYKHSEMFFDELVCGHGVEFHTWCINNTEHHFSYSKEEKLFYYDGKSSIHSNIKAGVYTFEQLTKIFYDTQWIGSYPFYCYENNEFNITPPTLSDTPAFLKKLSKK